VDRFATGSYLFETRALTVRRRLLSFALDPKFNLNNASILTDSGFSNNKIRFEEFKCAGSDWIFRSLAAGLLSSPGESHPEALRERNGKAVAVLIAPVDDDDVESLVVAGSPRLQKLLNKSRASIKAH